MILLLLAGVSFGATPQSTDSPDIRFEQKLGAQVPLDLVFRDEEGRPVRLGDLFGGRPVLLSLVYHRCPMTCGLVVNGLALGLKSVSLNAGEDFSVVTVSFDPSDTPALASRRKEEALSRWGHPESGRAWRFLTGEEEACFALCRAVGFHFSTDPRTGLFSHPTGSVVLTPEGRVSRYFLGVELPPRDLRLSLVEASRGTIGSLADGIVLLCSRYDPASGRYGVAVVTWVRGAGLATLLALGIYVWRAGVRERRRLAPVKP